MSGSIDDKSTVICYRVVIVNYAKSKAILRLLVQLSKQSLLPSSVCIIDNSPEQLALPANIATEEYPFLLDIQYTPENLGYAKACNLGAKAESWGWLVLLNPDIEISDALFFERLISLSATLPELGCVGVAQKNPDGNHELVARRFPTMWGILGKRVPIIGRVVLKRAVDSYLYSYPNDYEANADPFTVDWLQSSFLLLPRSAWLACNGLDERYFVFMSDTDFGLRCIQSGLKSWFVPNFYVHADGIRASGGGFFDILRKRSVRIHIIDAVRYFLMKIR